jgi:hypothetical protein
MPWKVSARESFPLVPKGSKTCGDVDRFLEADGMTVADVAAAWPADQGRSSAATADPRRVRAMAQMLAPLGLAYIEAPTRGLGAPDRNLVRVTELGRAVLRWRADGLVQASCRVIARYGARALAAAQLRNPTGEGADYPSGVLTFPFTFIWRAMLALDGRISSEELNEAVFHAMDEDGLHDAVRRIKTFRESGGPGSMWTKVATGDDRNDRIGIWMARASFGWTLISKKGTSIEFPDHYCITEPWAVRTIREVVVTRHRHREYRSVRAYVEHLSNCAGLPPDVRSGA